jgi:hypothetical protein
VSALQDSRNKTCLMLACGLERAFLHVHTRIFAFLWYVRIMR